LQGTTNASKIKVDQLTSENKDYWRAVLEMAPSDPSILFAHAHLHVARGETARGETYFLLGSLTMDDDLQEELATYQKSKAKLDERVAQDIQKGIELHDKGKYTNALETYDSVISQHTNSAWAFYEKGFSYLMMGSDDPELEKKRAEMYAKCRGRDPFYWKAYQGTDQKVIQQLMILLEKVHPFVSGDKRDLQSLKAFAEGCEEVELFPFAAHARWKLVQLDPKNMETHIKRFLDLLEKCGCKEADFFRKQFNFEKDDPTKPSTATE
jgi:tetratricopeptide (TPR) repeat protein